MTGLTCGLGPPRTPNFWRLLAQGSDPTHGSVSSPTSTGLLRGLMTCGADLKIRLHSSQAMDVNGPLRATKAGQGEQMNELVSWKDWASARSHVTEIV